MNTWTRTIRTDRHNLMERVCPHGIGHPDPDSLEWLGRIGVPDDGVHVCDGCCQRTPGTGVDNDGGRADAMTTES